MHLFYHLISLHRIQTILFTSNNHLAQKLLQLFRYLFISRKLNRNLYYLLQMSQVFHISPRKNPVKHFISHHSKTPNIALYRILRSLKNLDSHIIWSSNHCLLLGFIPLFSISYYFRKTKVCNFGLSIMY